MNYLSADLGLRLRFRKSLGGLRTAPTDIDGRETLLDSFSGRIESNTSDLYIENMLTVRPIRAKRLYLSNNAVGRDSSNASQHLFLTPRRAWICTR